MVPILSKGERGRVERKTGRRGREKGRKGRVRKGKRDCYDYLFSDPNLSVTDSLVSYQFDLRELNLHLRSVEPTNSRLILTGWERGSSALGWCYNRCGGLCIQSYWMRGRGGPSALFQCCAHIIPKFWLKIRVGVASHIQGPMLI